jgi:16S rRNA (adenine1518-N6/adenine1519-N6)-dimethyltransferase
MFAKKSLGQNFLNSPHAINDIIDAGAIKEGETILEIGPGKGVLTEALFKAGAHVVAVEKDDRMIPLLQEKFKAQIEYGKLKIIHGDILELKVEDIISGEYKLVANIPYYITGEIMRKFFETKNQPERMVLMVQKEVAERIARDPKESILSVSVKVYGEPKYIRTVKASAFIPAPNVDSAILLIENISKEFFITNCIDEKKFFEILKAGFAHKRKFLSKNLEDVAQKEGIEKAFASVGIDAKARAEDLTTEIWKNLVKELSR